LGPNVILILTDDQVAGTLQLMPNVRALARHGMTFSNAFISNSLCCPSRSSILTGLTSGHTGVWTNGDHDHTFGGWSAFQHNALNMDGSVYDGGNNARRTIASVLSNAGYRTGLYGKYLNHYERADPSVAPPIPPGWTNWFSFVGKNGSYYNYTINDQGQLEHYGMGGRSYSTDVVGRAARSFLQQKDVQDGSRPFFLYFAPYAPHGRAVPGPLDRGVQAPIPFESPAFNERTVSDKPPYVRRSKLIGGREIQSHRHWWNRMYGALVDVDRWVGRFERVLPAPVLADTDFVFLSDNGVEWGDHRLEFKGYPYERSIKVPLIFAGPGIDHGVNNGLASNLDIAPTISDLTGVTPPGPFDGTSLVRALAGTGRIKTNAILLEHESSKWVTSYCGLRTRRWKYVVYRNGAEELYDLRSDPYELHNVVTSDPRVRRRLRARTFAACDPLPPSWSTSAPP
jgi:arylsulfatase A-like enzyme